MNNVLFALAQIEVVPGRPDLNVAKMIKEIRAARERGVKVIAFPEMAVPGYLLGDEWEVEEFIRDLMSYNEDILCETEGIVAIWGNVFADFTKVGEDGRVRKYNAAFIAQDKGWVGNGVFKGYSFKTLMPKYREFDDERHFYSTVKLANERKKKPSSLLKPFPIVIDDQKINLGLILCEDMWSDDYSDKPTKILVDKGADVIVNISCSPWTWRKNDKRHRVVKSILEKSPVPFLYVNNTGVQNNGKNVFLFDGSSTAYNPDGSVRMCLPGYVEKTIDVDVDDKIHKVFEELQDDDRDARELHIGLIYAIKHFMASLGKKDVVIGLSGGVDSAIVCFLMAEALGPEHVFAVNMPSKYNSELTKNAAYTLAKNLGIHYAVFPIQESVDLTIDELGKTQFVRLDGSDEKTSLKVSGLILENIQARDRGSRVLAAIAACLGCVFTNNGNKSEVTVGWSTLYGDVNGAFAPIADLWKGEVYQEGRYCNKIDNRKPIPEEIFEVIPSAELSAEQDVTQGKGDPFVYPYHDKLFRAFVEFRFGPLKILSLYLSGELEKVLMIPKGLVKSIFKTDEEFITNLEKMWRLYKINFFKRIQAPPIIAVSKRAFGFDLRESQVQNDVYFTREFKKLKDLTLK